MEGLYLSADEDTDRQDLALVVLSGQGHRSTTTCDRSLESGQA